MFHLKDLRRRNVSTPSSNYDQHDLPAHDIHFPHDDHNNNKDDDSDVEDVLAPGDIVGQGSLLKGDVVSLLPTDSFFHPNEEDEREHFQVIKELGKGSYAVVYLVNQIFVTPRQYQSSSDDGHILGKMDNEGSNLTPNKTYGRKFAIKCLSKANLDKEELDMQMNEVTILQSLPLHSNIVALHKTLQTSSYLLLVLEYVAGEDLFYFLEQSRDDYPSFYPETHSHQTPPTPSLLSSSHPSHLLSRARLRLISSMFVQMCHAVAACHTVGVFHRDIKPENFIVTDGRYLDDRTGAAISQGRVIVKLTDFGLSTKEEECSDMDCGSAPYMSYECRNNLTPTYRPREADVWSLGIVLINMLYHMNPWTDTAHGACPSFTAFRQDPVYFFKSFTGMTQSFAEVLAKRVFCMDDQWNGGMKRMTAAELGAWVRNNLVEMLAQDENTSLGSAGSSSTVNGETAVARVVNNGHRLSLQMRVSYRPISRAASPFGGQLRSIGGVGGMAASPRMLPLALSRAPSVVPTLVKEEGEVVIGVGDVSVVQEESEQEERQEQEGVPRSTPSRTSTTRRRKRGARKKKGAASQDQEEEPDLKNLADASQTLARELSSSVKPPSIRDFPPLSKDPSSISLPISMGKSTQSRSVAVLAESTDSTTSSTTMNSSATVVKAIEQPTSIKGANSSSSLPLPQSQAVVKKPPKWMLRFGRNNSGGTASGPREVVVDGSSTVAKRNPRQAPIPIGGPGHSVSFPAGRHHQRTRAQPIMSPTVSNVTKVLMDLNAQQQETPMMVDHLPSSPPSMPWPRGRGTGESMAITSATRNAAKSPSRSPGPSISPNVPRSHPGVVSSASSSNISLVSSEQVQDTFQEGFSGYWRNRQPVVNENRVVGTGLTGRPLHSNGLGAGGGRHGSMLTARPFAKGVNSLSGYGTRSDGSSWRANGSMNSMNSTVLSVVNSRTSTNSSNMTATTSPGASTSAFTRYSNSTASLNTIATSVSSGSDVVTNWRNGGRGGAALKKSNLQQSKYMNGKAPESLNFPIEAPEILPIQEPTDPDFGTATPRRARTRNKRGNNANAANNNLNASRSLCTLKTTPPGAIETTSAFVGSHDLGSPNSSKLEPIFERPTVLDISVGQQQQDDSASMTGISTVAVVGSVGGIGDSLDVRKHASKSMTHLGNTIAAVGGSTTSNTATAANGEGTTTSGKAKKGQINTLAKLLFNLGRQ